MYQCRLSGCFVMIIWGLLQTISGQAQSVAIPDSSQSEIFDTVYIAPDTIKSVRVDTVFEYIEEATTPIKIRKRPKMALMFGSNVGLNMAKMYPMFNKLDLTQTVGINGMFMYNNLFADISILASTKESSNLEYNRHYTSLHHWTDTVKTVIDEYLEIIGKDTIKTFVYKISYIPKTDTLHSDSTFKHTNYYRNIHIPVLFGYMYKTAKTYIGIAFGPDFRIMFANSLNKVIFGDSSFVTESSYFKKLTVDFSGKLFVKQAVFKKLWTSFSMMGNWPLQSNYHDYTKELFHPSIFVTVGLEYYFKL